MRRPDTLRFLLLGGLLFTTAALTGGCTKDPTGPAPVVRPPVYAQATTEALAMANFRAAYEALDTAVYLDDCLDADYSFRFDPENLPLPTEPWDYDAETAATTALFTGADGYDALHEETVSGVSEIEVRKLLQLTEWEDVPASSPYLPGSRMARFEVALYFFKADGLSVMTVTGEQVFHVCAHEERVDGAPVTLWRVCGQQDLTAADKANGRTSWGDVKGYYR